LANREKVSCKVAEVGEYREGEWREILAHRVLYEQDCVSDLGVQLQKFRIAWYREFISKGMGMEIVENSVEGADNRN